MKGNEDENQQNSEDEYESTISRHTVESSVSAGSLTGANIEIDDGEYHHISADVDIEISGSTPTDRPYTYELLENIERAVVDEIRMFGDEVEVDSE